MSYQFLLNHYEKPNGIRITDSPDFVNRCNATYLYFKKSSIPCLSSISQVWK